MAPSEDFDAYEKYCQLGSTFNDKGAVWTVKQKMVSTYLAVKIYDLDQCQDEFRRLQAEIKLLRQLSHQNVIKHLASFSRDYELWITMPLYGFTSASRVVAAHFVDGLSEQCLCLIMKDILHALQYIHSKGIIHRAVKGSHILISADGHCVLSGFRHSISAISEGRWKRPIHSYPEEAEYFLNWCSPEILRQDVSGYCEKTDIYSLGITVCELGNGELPYSKLDPQLILVEKYFGREPFLYDAKTSQLLSSNGKDSGVGGSYADYLVSLPKMAEKSFSSAAHQFVANCLHANQDLRPSAEKLFSHPFIKQSKKIAQRLNKLLHPVTPINEETDFMTRAADLAKDEAEAGSTNSEDSWDFRYST